MKRKTLTVTVSRTRQVKQFEPVTVSLTEELILEDGDDIKEVRAKASKSLARAVDEQIAEAVKLMAKSSK